MKEFLGECVGVVVKQGPLGPDHFWYSLLVEDDGNWFPLRGDLDTAWISDMTKQLKKAKKYVNKKKKKLEHNEQ
ncbi:unnamed protein product [marine sediment metagenome]|uniref:Uncharacterized protein n=1 Tax=marine sediment metagenome TaxID=412755 RepID=X0S7Y8_9ZZZZ